MPMGFIHLNRNFSRSLLGIFFPLRCFNCKCHLSLDAAFPICDDCRSRLLENRGPYCSFCGRTISDPPTCLCGSKKGFRSLDEVYFLLHYGGASRKLIHRLKLRKDFTLIPFIKELIKKFIHQEALDFKKINLIIPVPSHALSLFGHSWQASAVLAQLFSRILGKPWMRNLKRSSSVPRQSLLGRRERFLNVRHAFSLRNGKPLPPSVLLVDDVLTTGSTGEACAALLKQNGVQRVSLIALARGGPA